MNTSHIETIMKAHGASLITRLSEDLAVWDTADQLFIVHGERIFRSPKTLFNDKLGPAVLEQMFGYEKALEIIGGRHKALAE